MKTDWNAKTTDTQIPTPPSVRISVQDFGPIENGAIDLRPLTVFVGPSNTGKTYFAILIYALHETLNGFPRLPVLFPYRADYGDGIGFVRSTLENVELREGEVRRVLEKLQTAQRTFRFSELPESVRNAVHAAVEDTELLSAFLAIDLERCFDIGSISELNRVSGGSDSMTISLEISEEDRPLWQFRLGISGPHITANGRIEDVVLLPEKWSDSGTMSNSIFGELIEQRRRLQSSYDNQERVQNFFDLLLHVAAYWRASSYYLPADRSGIMQSHRLITSALVARSTRTSLAGYPEFPTLPGGTADFMENLILYKEREERDELMKSLADALEREVLDGQILINRASPGGYPEFVYQPRKSKEIIRLTRVSSMVSELAPVALYLRGPIERGDMLIIEEPEAHLHPAAQTEMAKTLGRLVRAGVRVVVTTHSDWLLKEIGNLAREGELKEKTGEQYSEDPLPCSLQPSDVGVWQFCKDGTSKGATVEEIPYDRIEGVEPEEYEYVSEALYNRSADLQNQLAETAGGTKYKHE